MIFQRLILILILGLVAGCGTTPPAQPTSPPKPIATATEPAEVTEEVAESESPGEVLFNEFVEEVGFACVTCHYAASDERLLGPGLLSIKDRFETYELESDDLESYVKQSIQDPSAFIVPSESPFPENIMPRTYSDIFTDEQLDSLVEYIVSPK